MLFPITVHVCMYPEILLVLLLLIVNSCRMVVKSAGKIPGKQVGKNSFVW